LGYYQRAYGDLALQNARYSDALAYYLDFENYARLDNHPWSMAQAHAKLALAFAYLGELGRSRQESYRALTEMRRWGQNDLILQTLLAEPVCLAQESRLEEAIELSVFILSHPVSWNETKQQAQSILNEVENRLDRKIVKMAKVRGEQAKLEDMINRCLKPK
jgi:hypothetical protein